MHKSKIIGNFFQENEWEVQEWPAYSPDLNLIEYLWAILKQRLRKQTVFWENLEEKVYEIWNEIDADVVRNLYEKYTNRLIDVNEYYHTVVIATEKLSNTEAKPRCYDNFEGDNNRLIIFLINTCCDHFKIEQSFIDFSF